MGTSPDEVRVIHDGPLDGPGNMARDEALLARVGLGESPPTLRTYRWMPPTISLGYFQRFGEYADLPPPAGQLAVVRRLTGGGAILHDQELTYSLVLPAKHPLAAGAERLYALVHDALIECLKHHGVTAYRGAADDGSTAARGPFFCFARRHPLDVLIGEEKLAGSAQRRTRAAVLQHGSIVLKRRFPQQPSAELSGLDPDQLAEGFTAALTRSAGLSIIPQLWSEPELGVASRLTEKYASDRWTRVR